MVNVTTKHNKKLNKDKKQLAFAPSSLILTNYFLPVNWALVSRVLVLNKQLFDKFIYTRVFASLILVCVTGVWLLDVFLAYFGGIWTIVDYGWGLLAMLVVSSMFTIPCDMFLMYRNRIKSK